MLYAITNRRLYGTNEAQARERLLDQTAVWSANGVAYIQLREKDLSAREQVELARAIMDVIRKSQSNTRLLINSRADVAIAAGADGVHLPSGPDALTPKEVRSIFSDHTNAPCISISCHTLAEVEIARRQTPNCILFAPVFEKVVAEPENAQTIPGTGLALLEQACQLAAPIPVFALGGITADNAAQCLQAGAAGIAAIRLMQEPASAWKHLAG